jgi:Mrp family chromosome partitioning ATPase
MPMSRNFQLLKQLEIEADMTERHERALSDRDLPEKSPQKYGGEPPSEEILRLAQTVFLANTGRAPRQVVFCGVDEENGSSAVCASTGRAVALIGNKPVCLVDGNVRSPHLARALNFETPVPFPSRSAPIREQCTLIAQNLWLAAPELLVDDRGALLPAAELKQLLKHLRDTFEYVLIDAPAAGLSGDAAVLGLIADAAILVVEANSTRRLTARRTKDTLEALGVRLLGTVLRNRSFPLPKRIFKGR